MSELTPEQKELAAEALDETMPSDIGHATNWLFLVDEYQRQLAKVGLAIQPINEKETK